VVSVVPTLLPATSTRERNAETFAHGWFRGGDEGFFEEHEAWRGTQFREPGP
jgi:hypothetical protein